MRLFLCARCIRVQGEISLFRRSFLRRRTVFFYFPAASGHTYSSLEAFLFLFFITCGKNSVVTRQLPKKKEIYITPPGTIKRINRALKMRYSRTHLGFPARLNFREKKRKDFFYFRSSYGGQKCKFTLC